jgi:hypothetical protein
MQTAVEVPVRTIVCSVVAHHIVTVHPNDRMIFGCFRLILAPKLPSLHVDCLCTRMQGTVCTALCCRIVKGLTIIVKLIGGFVELIGEGMKLVSP